MKPKAAHIYRNKTQYPRQTNRPSKPILWNFVHIIQDEPLYPDNVQNRKILAIVEWTGMPPRLELRRWWKKKDGTYRPYKMIPLTAKDLATIQQNWQIILNYLSL